MPSLHAAWMPIGSCSNANSELGLQRASGPTALLADPLLQCSTGDRDLLRVIVDQEPGSLDELARITGKAKSNLSRTLKTIAGYGLVRLERGERGRIAPTVTHDRVELDLQLFLSRKAG